MNQAKLTEEFKDTIKQNKLQNQTRNTEKAIDIEVLILKQSIKAANRKKFACESEALHLAEDENQSKFVLIKIWFS